VVHAIDAAAPASKVTVVVTVVKFAGDVIASVFTWAVVDVIVQVDTPAPLLALHAFKVLFEPVDEKVGVVPTTGRFLPSINVMVMVEVATPFAVTGPVAAIVQFAAQGTPASGLKGDAVVANGNTDRSTGLQPDPNAATAMRIKTMLLIIILIGELC